MGYTHDKLMEMAYSPDCDAVQLALSLAKSLYIPTEKILKNYIQYSFYNWIYKSAFTHASKQGKWYNMASHNVVINIKTDYDGINIIKKEEYDITFVSQNKGDKMKFNIHKMKRDGKAFKQKLDTYQSPFLNTTNPDKWDLSKIKDIIVDYIYNDIKDEFNE